MITIMQQNYPGRLVKLFAINVGFTLQTIWSLISNFIDSFTENKVKILGTDYLEALEEYIDVKNLEQKFGGEYPNVTEEFYPPRLS